MTQMWLIARLQYSGHTQLLLMVQAQGSESQPILILILVGLFAALAIVVKITEKKGKPLDAEQQQRYSKIIMVLVFLTLLGAMFKQCS